PVTHDKGLALTSRQARKLLLNDFKNLSLLEVGGWRRKVARSIRRLQGLERVGIVVLAAPWRERGEQRRPERAHLLPAKPVAHRVLHDAVEEQRQLGRRALAVFLGEPQHRVLHDIERGFLVADREYRLLECPPLDAFEERLELA